jgi:tocopherol O-methyltransferase
VIRGQHIHHGYFLSETESKETAQVNLINLLLEQAKLPQNSTVLDVGCGIGGTTRHLAVEHGCTVTGITISGRQVQIANRLTSEQQSKQSPSAAAEPSVLESPCKNGFTPIGSSNGRIKFQELDAETMSSHFEPSTFDGVWISEALSHFPNKPLFFQNAARVLHTGGKLVIADWFKHTSLDTPQMQADIKQIEDGMLLPPLCTMEEYVAMAEQAGLKVFSEPKDISKQVAKTWDISWQLVSNPSLWAFAISQGRDGLSFLQSFRAMRRGYAEGSFRYGVMVFEKP